MSVGSLISSICVLALAEGSSMSAADLMSSLYVFALAAFLGYQVISRVPPLLHTPLMSATNAISAISVVGAILTAGGKYSQMSKFLGFIAVVTPVSSTKIRRFASICFTFCRNERRFFWTSGRSRWSAWRLFFLRVRPSPSRANHRRWPQRPLHRDRCPALPKHGLARPSSSHRSPQRHGCRQ